MYLLPHLLLVYVAVKISCDVLIVGVGVVVDSGVILIVGVIDGVIDIVGVIDGVIDIVGVIDGVTDIVGVIDIVGVTDGVIDIVGVTDGVIDGVTGTLFIQTQSSHSLLSTAFIQ
jgi:hypothetical protein